MTFIQARAATFAWTVILTSGAGIGAGGCRQSVEIGRNVASASESDAESMPTASTGDADATTQDASTCVPTRCRGRVRECADCADNDDDGLADSADPDCITPCDDSEDSLGDDLMCPPGDCFFDPDCGAGNDVQCLALSPNGCDCFGCCAVPATGDYVALGSLAADGTASCTSAVLADPQLCQPCTPDPTCFDACGACELCFGMTELPPECRSDASCSLPTCDEGQAACGGCAGQCAEDELCISGCCSAAP